MLFMNFLKSLPPSSVTYRPNSVPTKRQVRIVVIFAQGVDVALRRQVPSETLVQGLAVVGRLEQVRPVIVVPVGYPSET